MATTTEVLYRFDRMLDDAELDIILSLCNGPALSNVHEVIKKNRAARLAGTKEPSIEFAKEDVRHIDWQLHTYAQLCSRSFGKVGNEKERAQALAYYKLWGKVQSVIMEQASKASSGFIPKHSLEF